MKNVLPFLIVALSSCYYTIPAPPLADNDQQHTRRNKMQARCSQVTDYVQDYRSATWEKTIQRIRNAYTNVVKIVNDKEVIDFSVAFMNCLSTSETLDLQSRNLFEIYNKYLPDTESLKFFYRAEKELNELILNLHRFTNSPNSEIKQCANEAESFLCTQRDLFIAIREIDYRLLNLDDLSQTIPSEVIRSHAKFLEQRDSMADQLISFYNSFVGSST